MAAYLIEPPTAATPATDYTTALSDISTALTSIETALASSTDYTTALSDISTSVSSQANYSTTLSSIASDIDSIRQQLEIHNTHFSTHNTHFSTQVEKITHIDDHLDTNKINNLAGRISNIDSHLNTDSTSVKVRLIGVSATFAQNEIVRTATGLGRVVFYNNSDYNSVVEKSLSIRVTSVANEKNVFNVSSTEGLYEGMVVTGSSIPKDTLISKILDEVTFAVNKDPSTFLKNDLISINNSGSSSLLLTEVQGYMSIGQTLSGDSSAASASIQNLENYEQFSSKVKEHIIRESAGSATVVHVNGEFVENELVIGQHSLTVAKVTEFKPFNLNKVTVYYAGQGAFDVGQRVIGSTSKVSGVIERIIPISNRNRVLSTSSRPLRNRRTQVTELLEIRTEGKFLSNERIVSDNKTAIVRSVVIESKGTLLLKNIHGIFRESEPLVGNVSLAKAEMTDYSDYIFIKNEDLAAGLNPKQSRAITVANLKEAEFVDKVNAEIANPTPLIGD